MGDTTTKIALTSLSVAVAETATFPIDITKTRLQLHGEHAHQSSSSSSSMIWGVVYEIWREGRVLGFYKGLSPTVLRHLFYTPIRIVGYENLRGVAGDSVMAKAVAGGASGVLAQVYFAPIFFSRRMSSSISWIFTSILHFNSWSMIFSFDINVEFPFFFSFFFWEQSLNLVRCYGLVWFRFLWRSCHLELIKNVRWS